MTDLLRPLEAPVTEIVPGVFHCRNRVDTAVLRPWIDRITEQSPFRQLRTKQGVMSVALTNAGDFGWHSDVSGYRYVSIDPHTHKPWPEIPDVFMQLATSVAAEVGFAGFIPDCCLVNRYAVGAKMGAHRDFDEQDYRWPIVSVSIGLAADFVWYGERKDNSPTVIRVEDGDVVVFGGQARKGFHAVRAVKHPKHPTPFDCRYNLTFRRSH